MKQKPSKPLNYEKAARSDLRLVQCVHGDSKFRIVELVGTEVGTLRTCARVPRARARAARAIRLSPSQLFIIILSRNLM